MITAAVLGIGLIFVMAGVVGAMDAARAAMWREVAAERRQSWEARVRPATDEDEDEDEPDVPAAIERTAARGAG